MSEILLKKPGSTWKIKIDFYWPPCYNFVCAFCNPTSPSDLPSNIADSQLFISKTCNKFFLKDKIFQISCLKNAHDLEVSFKQRNPQIVIL